MTVNSSRTRRKSGFFTELIDLLDFKPVLSFHGTGHGTWWQNEMGQRLFSFS